MKISFVYILLCSDGTYYTGVTSNIEKRYEQHQSAKYKDSYTANRLPVELVFYATFTNISVAIDTEKQIKKWSKSKKKALIEGRYEDLINLAKKKF